MKSASSWLLARICNEMHSQQQYKISPSVLSTYMGHVYLYCINVILYSQNTNIYANSHMLPMSLNVSFNALSYAHNLLLPVYYF